MIKKFAKSRKSIMVSIQKNNDHGGPLYQKCGHLTKGVATPSIFDIFTSFQSSIHLLACSELFYVSDF